MYGNNIGDALALLAIVPAQEINADGNSAAFDLTGAPANSPNTGSLNYEGQLALVLQSLNTAGTNPTLAIKLQTSDTTTSGDFADVSGAAYTGLTTAASAQKLVVNKDQLKRYIRFNFDIGGTDTPAYTLGITGLVAKKNPA
jgi:hypothetical protein